MGLRALVMAGGMGTRMRLSGEKPLAKIFGKPIVEYVVDSLRRSGRFEQVAAAVSKHTPESARRLAELGVVLVETSGDDYVLDMKYAIKKLGRGVFMVVSADLPLLTEDAIVEVVERFVGCSKPSLAVMVPLNVYTALGLEPDFKLKVGGRFLVPCGVNFIDGSRIDEATLDEETMVFGMAEPFVNVNTVEDLEFAERCMGRAAER